MSNSGNKTYNRIYDVALFRKIDGARHDLSGFYYFDYESGQEYRTPSKDEVKFRSAYYYCFKALWMYYDLADTFKEILLIRAQIQHSQDFAVQNDHCTTEEILNFSYKNWILRVNMIVEKMFELTNHIYQLQISNVDTINKVFESPHIKANQNLYLALLSLADFLHDNTLVFVKTKSLKKSRNQILHNSKFEHETITKLSNELFLSKYSTHRLDEEDLYILEGMTSEKIKNEISNLSELLHSKCSVLFDLFAVEFDITSSDFFKKGSDLE